MGKELNSSAEKDLGVLTDSELNAAKKLRSMLGCNNRGTASRLRRVTLPSILDHSWNAALWF